MEVWELDEVVVLLSDDVLDWDEELVVVDDDEVVEVVLSAQ